MKIESIAIPLPFENIDTDQIIPAKFLKQTIKTGLGKSVFYNWRYDDHGKLHGRSPMDAPERQNAQVLITGNNFGCGSSREHAAWALADFGIKAIVSSQFADIFKGNAYNNGMLPIELPEAAVNEMMKHCATHPASSIEIDLSSQEISIKDMGYKAHFDIAPFKKECLLHGVDETQYLLNLSTEILAYENAVAQKTAAWTKK